jgi:uncharacterized protein
MGRYFFLFSIVGIVLSIDSYLWQAVKLLIKSSSVTTQQVSTWVFWGISIISILVITSFFVFTPASLNPQVRNLIAVAILIVYASKLFGVVVLFIEDITRAFRWFFSQFQKVISNQEVTVTESIDTQTQNIEKISRSEFVAKTALAVGGLHLGAMTWGIISGAHDYRIRRVTLKLKNLPKQFDGMRIAQLSDIHSGSFFNKTAVKGGVEMLLAEKPDVVFFTGDLVNNEAKEVTDYINIFDKVKAPLGVYSTLGNHDYGDYVQWASPEAKSQNLKNLMKSHEMMGWNLLMDEHRELKVDGEAIAILGIQNWGAGNFAKYGMLNKALKNTDDYSTKLLLSHDPSHWRNQVLGKTDIDAAFAGHTHGMQYGVEIGGFKWSPVQFRYKEWAGLYQEADQQLYVNRGFGYIGYPGRLGILPEITIFELKKG